MLCWVVLGLDTDYSCLVGGFVVVWLWVWGWCGVLDLVWCGL